MRYYNSVQLPCLSLLPLKKISSDSLAQKLSNGTCVWCGGGGGWWVGGGAVWDQNYNGMGIWNHL